MYFLGLFLYLCHVCIGIAEFVHHRFGKMIPYVTVMGFIMHSLVSIVCIVSHSCTSLSCYLLRIPLWCSLDTVATFYVLWTSASQLHYIGSIISVFGASLNILASFLLHYLYSDCNIMIIDLVSCTAGKFPFLTCWRFYILPLALKVLILAFWNWNLYSDAQRCSVVTGKGKLSVVHFLVLSFVLFDPQKSYLKVYTAARK